MFKRKQKMHNSIEKLPTNNQNLYNNNKHRATQLECLNLRFIIFAELTELHEDKLCAYKSSSTMSCQPPRDEHNLDMPYSSTSGKVSKSSLLSPLPPGRD